MVSSATLLSDTILFIRDTLRANITDPLVSVRTSNAFVFTSYPNAEVVYPIITVRGKVDGDSPAGQASEQRIVSLVLEVRVWARNEKEKNNLYDAIYAHLRTNQYPYSTSGTSLNQELWDFGINFANDLDEPGEEGVKSKIMEYRYKFITV